MNDALEMQWKILQTKVPLFPVSSAGTWEWDSVVWTPCSPGLGGTCLRTLRIFMFNVLLELYHELGKTDLKISTEAQNPIRPPPPYTLYSTVYTCTGYTVYGTGTYSHREGGGGNESWSREKGRGATVHKAGSKNTNMIDNISRI